MIDMNEAVIYDGVFNNAAVSSAVGGIILAGKGSTYLCHTVPGFQQVWRERRVDDDYGTINGLIYRHAPELAIEAVARLVRTAYVVYANPPFETEWSELEDDLLCLLGAIRDGDITELTLRNRIKDLHNRSVA